ncbi:prepilin peptidase [Actinomadura parmotrematis]|uniref:A24 family peptidase n=1 Tax=Actinomadura parmotrematis TaxID=2864039 RepID=A0ABS7FXD3_9ACTN|nr:A24 family peptidase [Actinomadura parmotrematis]MBW8484946.1 A24 family peptidase [Actinomadura parmotrematis]
MPPDQSDADAVLGTTAADEGAGASGTAWSRHADWTEPLRRRPLPVALAALAVAALLAWRAGPRPDAAALAYLGAVGVVLSAVDVALERLPDPLTLTGYPIGAALLGGAALFTDGGGGRYLAALAGMAGLGLLFAAQWFLVPRAMGFGDVKLSGVLGLYLGWFGWPAWALGLFAMFALGGVFAVLMLLARRAGRRTSFPFGPFMVAGTVLAVLVHA